MTEFLHPDIFNIKIGKNKFTDDIVELDLHSIYKDNQVPKLFEEKFVQC